MRNKKDFFVFDFCGNLDYFSQDLPGSEGSLQKSLTQRIFESRLGLVVALDHATAPSDLRRTTADWLQEFVAGMNLDNVLVRAQREQVETWSSRARWDSVSQGDANGILSHLAGLPSTVQDPEEEAKRFDLLVLRRQLAQLEGDAAQAERIRETVQAIAAALLPRKTIPSVAAQLQLLDEVAGDEWWVDVTLPMLEVMRLRLRGLVRFVEKTRQNPVYTGLHRLRRHPRRRVTCEAARRHVGDELGALPRESPGLPESARGPRRLASAVPQQVADGRGPGLAGEDAGGGRPRPAGRPGVGHRTCRRTWPVRLALATSERKGTDAGRACLLVTRAARPVPVGGGLRTVRHQPE